MPEIVWQQCVDRLRDELPSQQFHTWIRPLQVQRNDTAFTLYAPNRFIKDFVAEKYRERIQELVRELALDAGIDVVVDIEAAGGARQTQGRTQALTESRVESVPELVVDNVQPATSLGSSSLENASLGNASLENSSPESIHPEIMSQGSPSTAQPVRSLRAAHTNDLSSPAPREPGVVAPRRVEVEGSITHKQHHLVDNYTFESFVEGKSNQLALAAAQQVAENPGDSYNPLFLYGGVGLGKTHLMHAVGHALKAQNPEAKVVYLHSERFVADMVKALQLNAINDFKRFYRSVDALLIDDIQFFAKKDRSQEEFFHTFNALLEGGQQMILTCDRYPKEIDGLEERLKSRFGWGLTVAVEPPELETRVAILMKKAAEARVELPPEAAFFIAQRIRSNVRELEGALKRVMASAHFIGKPIDIELIKDSLKDLLALQDRQVSMDNIQRTAAEYYKIKVADMMSRRRSRSVARPRQMAMALSKELTNHSLPEIGDSFGGRDHTTVLHACRKIKELRETNSDIREDYKNLLRSLTT